MNSRISHRILSLPLVLSFGWLVFSCAACSNAVNTGEGLAHAELLQSTANKSVSNDDDDDKKAGKKKDATQDENKTEDATVEENLQTATFGNGCYWCTEAVFQRVRGVKSVVSGFSGGRVKNPTYYQVCKGHTGHAEVLQITYDANQVSFGKLLEIFWKTHDPTTLNQQGPDYGTQYRSAIFYHNEEQRELAFKYKKLLTKSGAFRNPIVTEITKFKEFYPAPEEHQDYYNRKKEENPYCEMIYYKLEKFREAFADVIDEEKDVVK